jgi:hypothetical protein
MPLRNFMTASATTLRATISSGKIGAPSAYLTNVLVQPPQLPSAEGQHAVRTMIGLEGSAGQVFAIYTESHTHTQSGGSVTKVPDIEVDDQITVGGVTYYIHWAEVNSATSSFGQTLLIYVTENKRA